MPILVTQVSTVVIRDGKRFSPPIGKPFNYTDAEVKTILGGKPLGLRKPVNEVVPVEPVEQDVPEPESEDEDEDITAEDEDADITAEDEDEDEQAPKPKAKAKKPAAKKKPAKADDEDDDI